MTREKASGQILAREIIINADDFGSSSSINRAIVESFHSGKITGTTIMANMPGFDEAVELAHQNSLIGRTGIHLNLTEGLPLTRDIFNTNLFYNERNSDLKKHKKYLFHLDTHEKNLIYNEFAAQIEKVKKAGLQITHIDTHHHIDEVWAIIQIIQALLRKYGIPSMRILNNLNQSTRVYKKVYRRLVNELIRMNHFNYTDFMGNQHESVAHLMNNPSFFKNMKLEIMVHPDYNKSGSLVDKINKTENNFVYPEKLAKFLASQNTF